MLLVMCKAIRKTSLHQANARAHFPQNMLAAKAMAIYMQDTEVSEAMTLMQQVRQLPMQLNNSLT